MRLGPGRRQAEERHVGGGCAHPDDGGRYNICFDTPLPDSEAVWHPTASKHLQRCEKGAGRMIENCYHEQMRWV